MAVGDIGAVIDSFEFDTSECNNSKIINVTGDIYAIVYEGTGFEGELKTISITDAGDIGAAVIDSFQIDAAAGRFPDILHVTGNVYAVVYSRRVSTITIDAAGNIGAAFLDTLLLEGVQADYQNIIHIFGEVYAIAYTGPGSDGKIKTVTIAANGDIGASAIDTFTFDAGAGNYPRIIHVYSNVYAIAYAGVGNDGWLKTVLIADNGDIGAAVIDSLEFDAVAGNNPNIVHVSGNFFAIAYTDDGYNGVLVTVEIDNSGNITAALVDSFEFESAWASNISLINPFGTLYAMAYYGPDADGWLKTINIDNSGNIAASIVDSFEFDTNTAVQPCLIYLSGDIFAIAYTDADADGILKTVNIETPSIGGPRHELLMGIG